METSLTNIRIMMHNELENERTMNYVGGNSSVLLFLLSSGNIQITQNALEQARILNETVPGKNYFNVTQRLNYILSLFKNNMSLQI